jgi:hypothetical protein
MPADPIPRQVVATLDAQPARGACTSARHRQFDFWLGAWTIADATTSAPAGTSQVTALLGGCAVEESFTAANGARGRSLNVFDRESRRWYQTFVGVFGQNFRIAGAPVDGIAMQLVGRRSAFQGTNPSRISWVKAQGGTVRQTIENSFDGGATWLPGFDGIYTPANAIAPAPPLLPGICPRVAVFRQFDFVLGSWVVHGPAGKPVARADIRADLDQCLIVERVSGGEDQSMSYFFFDLGTGSWVRATADDTGRYLELSGSLASDGSMRFSGNSPLGSPGTVSNAWTPQSDGSLTQAWTGAGGTRTFTYRRASS